MPRRLGVLGGMGPLACVDFLAKLIEETPAVRDQDHVPVVVYGVPQIPCRVEAILGSGASPLPAMAAGLEILARAGAEAAVIACNTAHHWYDELARVTTLPILHIADAACAGIPAGSRVGLLGTEAALEADIYQRRLTALNVRSLVNAPDLRARSVLPAIALVKQGEPEEAGRRLGPALEDLFDQGADSIILACTELPLALGAEVSSARGRLIDPTRALARAAVTWSFS
jgi:aspartate racemase